MFSFNEVPKNIQITLRFPRARSLAMGTDKRKPSDYPEVNPLETKGNQGVSDKVF